MCISSPSTVVYPLPSPSTTKRSAAAVCPVALGPLPRLHELHRHLDGPGGGLERREPGVHQLHRAALGRLVDVPQLDHLRRTP